MQLFRSTTPALASLETDKPRRKGVIVKAMQWRRRLRHLRTGRFGVYHSLPSDS